MPELAGLTLSWRFVGTSLSAAPECELLNMKVTKIAVGRIAVLIFIVYLSGFARSGYGDS